MSKIEVNEIDVQSGSTITVGSACKSVAVPGNVVKTNAVQASDAGNIISQSGTTITIGASGDTVSLASGASQSGFGRSGSVDWQTGSIKTATFTAASGEGYFADTSSGAFNMNLPAGTAGAIVSIADYTRTFQTNNLTIVPNGSQKIGGINANLALSTEGQSLTFVYVDDTEGWINTSESTGSSATVPFITATGGTITTSGDCKIHTFTGPGTFAVTASTTPANNEVSYLVIAGGGAGGLFNGAGGGAGGFRESKAPITPYSASPLDGYPNSGNRITVSTQSYPITVGGGGAAVTLPCSPNSVVRGNDGAVSTFSTITSAGGGGGGSNGLGKAGGNGGSGGGATDGGTGGSGNTPPTTPAQGTNGGPSSTPSSGGGGGGATQVGDPASTPCQGANAGNGAATSITGSPVTRAGGGGGGGRPPQGPNVPSGGSGGGGNGSNNGNGTNGTANTGSGGGATGTPCGSGPKTNGGGGSGIVVIRYKYQ
jgi:hypothetical protein